MSLVEIAEELKNQVRGFKDYHNGKIITYHFESRIIEEERRKDGGRRIYLEGHFTYSTNFETHPSGTKKKRALNAGRMGVAPTKNVELRRDSIVSFAKELTNERSYRVSYDEKKDRIIIFVFRNLYWELKQTKRTLGDPVRQEFRV
tara:strand:- start:462 stop:899 length:438 start_codon:yes stop_codon:yes gene_type:complete